MNLTEEDWKRMSQERADMLDALTKVTAIAARNEAALVKAMDDMRSVTTSQNYWVAECNRKTAMIRDLENRINELSSPLAELARAAKE